MRNLLASVAIAAACLVGSRLPFPAEAAAIPLPALADGGVWVGDAGVAILTGRCQNAWQAVIRCPATTGDQSPRVKFCETSSCAAVGATTGPTASNDLRLATDTTYDMGVPRGYCYAHFATDDGGFPTCGIWYEFPPYLPGVVTQ